jgi:NADH-quinone oxidoreductase subunit N
VGKWYIFDALVRAGQTPMAVVIALNTALSAIYYVRPVLYAYAGQPRSDQEIAVSTPVAIVTATAAMVVGLGVFFAAPLVDAARSSAQLQATTSGAPAASPAPGLFFTAPTFEKGQR